MLRRVVSPSHLPVSLLVYILRRPCATLLSVAGLCAFLARFTVGLTFPFHWWVTFSRLVAHHPFHWWASKAGPGPMDPHNGEHS